MKKIIRIIALICVMALSLTSCEILGGLFDPNKKEYNNALKLIEEKKYEEAYEILNSLENNEDAKEYLNHFYFIPTKVSSNYVFEFTYNESYLPTKIHRVYETYSHTTDNVYDANGNLIQSAVTDTSYDNTTIYNHTYDSVGNLIKSVITYTNDDASNIIDYTYDTNGNLIKEVSTTNYGSKYNNASFKKVFDYTYDDNGNLIKEAYAMVIDDVITEDREYRYEYDHNGRLLRKYVDDNLSYGYEYDENGNIVREYNAAHTCYEREYDANGNIIKYVQMDAGGISSVYEYTYDTNGRLIKTTYEDRDMSKFSIDYEYDLHGNLIKETTTYLPNKKSTVEYTYNKFGVITNVTATQKNGTIYSVDFEWMLVYIPGELPEILAPWVNIVDLLA